MTLARSAAAQLGGKILGSSRFPLSTSDFSSFLIQAQAPKSKILALASSGDDTKNSICAANEFGVNKQMVLAGLTMFIHDAHGLTLAQTKNMYLNESCYWDQDDASRKWARRYFGQMRGRFVFHVVIGDLDSSTGVGVTIGDR